VIGEVFFLFSFILFYYYFHFCFVFQKPTTGSPGGIGVWPPYPNSVRTCIQNYVGDVTDDGVGGIMEPGSENNKCLGL